MPRLPLFVAVTILLTAILQGVLVFAGESARVPHTRPRAERVELSEAFVLDTRRSWIASRQSHSERWLADGWRVQYPQLDKGAVWRIDTVSVGFPFRCLHQLVLEDPYGRGRAWGWDAGVMGVMRPRWTISPLPFVMNCAVVGAGLLVMAGVRNAVSGRKSSVQPVPGGQRPREVGGRTEA